MLRHDIPRAVKAQCRQLTTSACRLRPIPVLENATLETFRTEAFAPAIPVLLPGQFNHIPAIQSWFLRHSNNAAVTLNRDHLGKFGSTIVPLEVTQNGQFARIEQPLSFFLDASTSIVTGTQVYLAQAPLSDLPPGLSQDLPVPELVLKAGRGDIYSSSIWLGRAPTYTPLHRDPNPNLFVQLAGRKIVRMYQPHVGLSIFDAVQERVGGVGKANLRGVEMMEGAEREALEDEVWKHDDARAGGCWDAQVGVGDALFIPKGWWHSIKSVHGEGVIGSVNWWFR